MSVAFTVLLPVHRPPALLPYAMECVLAQTFVDFELFVICDGASNETAACAQTYAARDARVRVFQFPKGERHGEAHRNTALAEASGRYVAHIADDDLWMPNHLAEMAELLREVDFGNLLHLHVHPGERLELLPCDLSRPWLRQRMLQERHNRFGLSFGGYRLAAYRRLSQGWSPAPATMWTDLHMWRKFLSRTDMSFGTRMAVTGLCLLSPTRREMSLDERAAENRKWRQRIEQDTERCRIVEAAWRSLVSDQLAREEILSAKDQALAAKDQALAAKDQLLAAKDQLLAAKDESLTATDQALLAKDNAVTVVTAERERCERELRTIRQSMSWRGTAPLRWVSSRAKGWLDWDR